MKEGLKNMIRELLIRLGLVLIGCMIGLFAFEIGFRIFLHQSTSLYQYSPIYGWEHIPNKVGYWREETEKPVMIKINSRKLRDREFSYIKKNGVFRILMLGDSFTEAFQVPLEYAASKILESLLNSQRKSTIIEVINTGVAGYGTAQEFLFLKHEGIKYHPNLIMVNFFCNDVIDNVHSDGGKRPLWSIKNGKLEPNFSQPKPEHEVLVVMRKILAYSHLALWAKREIGRLFSNFGLAMRKEDEYIPIQGYPEVNLNEFHRGIKITKGLLSEIQNFQRKLGQNLLYF